MTVKQTLKRPMAVSLDDELKLVQAGWKHAQRGGFPGDNPHTNDDSRRPLWLRGFLSYIAHKGGAGNGGAPMPAGFAGCA